MFRSLIAYVSNIYALSYDDLFLSLRHKFSGIVMAAEEYRVASEFETRRRVQELEASQPKYRMTYEEFQKKHREDLEAIAGGLTEKYVFSLLWDRSSMIHASISPHNALIY